MFKFTKFLLIFLVLTIQAKAQHWSYVYIQGDKETPFYVKLEDEMLPRYSKNYYIIPQLEEGPIHIQILFQQNIYPPQSFTIQVPKDGNRSFLLTHKNDAFSLYDIQQKTYLLPGVNEVALAPSSPSTNVAIEEKPVTTTNPTSNPNAKDPNFINNIELNNNHAVAGSSNEAPATNQPQPEAAKPTQEQYNIAQEKAVNEMPVEKPAPVETIPPPTVKQQVQEDINKIKDSLASQDVPQKEQGDNNNIKDTVVIQETPPNENEVAVQQPEPTTKEPNNSISQTETATDFSKANPVTQPVQEPVSTVENTAPIQAVQETKEAVQQTTIPEKNVSQQAETTLPHQTQVVQTEQPKQVPTPEVIKAEEEYYKAHKANNEIPENTNQQLANTPPPEQQTNNRMQEAPRNTVPATVVDPAQTLPPAPPHPTAYYQREEEVALSSENTPIVNSVCPTPVSDKEFDKIYSADKSKSDGRDRLKYLMNEADENCFTTRQVYFLAKEISAESMRYSFLKKVYARVTDQQNFKLLEDNLFKTLEWKSYFRTIQ